MIQALVRDKGNVARVILFFSPKTMEEQTNHIKVGRGEGGPRRREGQGLDDEAHFQH